jgi:hypothetical protein
MEIKYNKYKYEYIYIYTNEGPYDPSFGFRWGAPAPHVNKRRARPSSKEKKIYIKKTGRK